MAESLDVSPLRLFFALWPDAELREQIAGQYAVVMAGQQESTVGRAVPPANYHVTLAYLGDVSADDLAAVQAAGQQIRFSRFDLQLSQSGYWPRSRIAWLAPAVAPAGLTTLVDRLWTELAGLGFRRETRPYKPHVSLARNASSGPEVQPNSPLEWPVNSFVLVNSTSLPQGSGYTQLQQYCADD